MTDKQRKACSALFFMGSAAVLTAAGSNWWLGAAAFMALCAVDMIVCTITTDHDWM